MQLATFHPDFRFADSAGVLGTHATFQPWESSKESTKSRAKLSISQANFINFLPDSWLVCHQWFPGSHQPFPPLSSVGFVENHQATYLAPQAGPNDAADFVGRAPAPAFDLLREKERRLNSLLRVLNFRHLAVLESFNQAWVEPF